MSDEIHMHQIHQDFLGRYYGEIPTESIKFLHKLLTHIENDYEKSFLDRKEKQKFINKLDGMFYNDNGIRNTILSMLVSHEIIDHIEDNMPGWLTQKGRLFFNNLNDIYGLI